eukprot:536697-Amphidinium_carterae.1
MSQQKVMQLHSVHWGRLSQRDRDMYGARALVTRASSESQRARMVEALQQELLACTKRMSTHPSPAGAMQMSRCAWSELALQRLASNCATCDWSKAAVGSAQFTGVWPSHNKVAGHQHQVWQGLRECSVVLIMHRRCANSPQALGDSWSADTLLGSKDATGKGLLDVY